MLHDMNVNYILSQDFFGVVEFFSQISPLALKSPNYPSVYKIMACTMLIIFVIGNRQFHNRSLLMETNQPLLIKILKMLIFLPFFPYTITCRYNQSFFKCVNFYTILICDILSVTPLFFSKILTQHHYILYFIVILVCYEHGP